MFLGYEPDISHLRTFGCAVQVPIAPPKRTKMGPKRRLGIYVGFDSPSIIRFLEPTTGDLFSARFADCHFNETMFPSIGTPKIEMVAKHKPVKVFSWNEKNLSQFNPRTPECENEVQRIIHLQAISNRLLDAFNDATKVTKSHIPAVNAPARIAVPEGQAKMDEIPPQLKRGRPIGSNDTVPRQRRGKNQKSTPEEPGAMLTSKQLNVVEVAQTHEMVTNLRNTENSITYCNEIWDRNKIIIDDIFAFSVAHKIMDDACELQSIIECRQRQDWSKWEEAIKAELAFLAKQEVFGPITRIPDNVKPIGYKWVFVRKLNEENKVVRYKARLVAQGFSQRPGIDYDETYSPVMDMITFRFLISLVLFEKLEMRLMDIVTAYLYGSLNSNIYMKIPEGFKMPDACTPRNLFSIKLQRSLYGLKQSSRMWYQRLSEYVIKERYKNDPICPCVFINKSKTGFSIVAVYVDDINLIGTPEELAKTA